MTREEAIHELQEDKRLYETEVCHAGDGSPDGRLLEAIDMAIEALTHEIRTETHGVCLDLISRADAIECLGNCHDICDYTEDVVARIEALLSADAVEHDGCKNCRYEQNTEWEYPCKYCKQNYEDKWEQKPSNTSKWIPCSERLPKEKQEVYVTVYFIEGDTGRAYGYMDGFGRWHLYSTVEGTLNSGYEVIAWMPLPKPYREEREV